LDSDASDALRDSAGLRQFGLQAFTFVPDTPLQSRSLRPQSSLVLQTFTQVLPAPDTLSQIDPSGHPSVEPDVVHDFVQ
jgi:hypothetical protein